jgi:RNA polymerase sigma-70 factor (ECF subfamily)
MVRRRPWWSVLRMEAPNVPREFGEDAAVGRLDLREALAALSAPDRVALFLYYYLDLPIEEVARVLGVSVNGSKSRIHRALLRLRPGLEIEEVRP